MDQAVSRLPDEVRVALAGIAEAAREGLLALSVRTGPAVLSEMMETERTGLCGPIHEKNPDRVATRGGTTPTSVVPGGRRVATRRCPAADEPVGEKVETSSSSMSKSSVSRRFVAGTRKALDGLLGRDLSGLEVAVLMVDGVDFAGQCCVVAMVITAEGTRVPVGLRQGDTENGTLVKALLADLVERGLDASGGLLVIIDGAKALRSAVKSVFGDLAVIAGDCRAFCVRGAKQGLAVPALERKRHVRDFAGVVGRVVG